MSERVEAVGGAVYILDPSFAVRPGFGSFWVRLPAAHRRTAIVPQGTLDVLDAWADGHPVGAARELARRAAWVLRGHRPRGAHEPPATAGEPAARAELLARARAVRRSVVVLTDHPATLLASEADQQATPPARRRPRAYATLPGFHATLTVRPTWYPPARRSLLRRVVSFWRAAPDPVPPFAEARAARAVAPDRPAGVGARPGTRLTAGSGVGGRLGARLAAADGAEGELFAVDGRPRLVCKVYLPHQQRPERAAKLAALVRRALPDPAVCWPLDTVSAAGGPVVGFVMPRAGRPGGPPPQPLARGLLLDPAEFQRAHPGWTRQHSVALAVRVAELVARLHHLGVVVGDLSADNVLVDPAALADDREGVWLVDCDSVQVGDLPCPVGRDEYTPAGRQGADFGASLRARGDDLFALAVLLFQVLNPGRHPFQCRDARGGPGDWIRAGVFPYAQLGTPAPAHRVPTAYDAFAWSHLSPELRGLFARAFVPGARRPAVEEWLGALHAYGAVLSDPDRVYRSPFVGRIDLNIAPPVGYADAPAEPEPTE